MVKRTLDQLLHRQNNAGNGGSWGERARGGAGDTGERMEKRKRIQRRERKVERASSIVVSNERRKKGTVMDARRYDFSTTMVT